MPQEPLQPGSQHTVALQPQAVGVVLGAHDAHTAVDSAKCTEACRVSAAEWDAVGFGMASIM